MADDRVARSLEKLKAQQKKPEPKKTGFFRDITDMDFDQSEDEKKQVESEKTEKDSTFIRKIEVLMRQMDEITGKMSAGSNYLTYYGQMQELETKFLEATKDIETQKDNVPPQMFNRIIARKNNILKKKRK